MRANRDDPAMRGAGMLSRLLGICQNVFELTLHFYLAVLQDDNMVGPTQDGRPVRYQKTGLFAVFEHSLQ